MTDKIKKIIAREGLVIVGILLLSQLMPISCVQAENVYHNEEGHFSLVLPGECEEMSKNVLSAYSNNVIQAKLSAGFWSRGENNYFILLDVKKVGKLAGSELKKISNSAVKQKNWETVFMDAQKLGSDEYIYNDNKHSLYEKSEILIPSYSKRIAGVNVTIFSNYGAVAMAFYSAKNFDTAVNDFNQILNSFKFDEGYQY